VQPFPGGPGIRVGLGADRRLVAERLADVDQNVGAGGVGQTDQLVDRLDDTPVGRDVRDDDQGEPVGELRLGPVEVEASVSVLGQLDDGQRPLGGHSLDDHPGRGELGPRQADAGGGWDAGRGLYDASRDHDLPPGRDHRASGRLAGGPIGAGAGPLRRRHVLDLQRPGDPGDHRSPPG
jgi:hypothetical protein